MYFSRMLILTSSQAVQGGVTTNFYCLCFIPHGDVSWGICTTSAVGRCGEDEEQRAQGARQCMEWVLQSQGQPDRRRHLHQLNLFEVGITDLSLKKELSNNWNQALLTQ